LVQGCDPVGGNSACFGIRCALTRIISAFELAVGALEVVLIEATPTFDPPVIVELKYVQGRRLVTGVIPHAKPT